MLFIFDFISINDFLFSNFLSSFILSKISKNLLKIDGTQALGSFGIKSITLIFFGFKSFISDKYNLICFISSLFKSSSNILWPVKILGVIS